MGLFLILLLVLLIFVGKFRRFVWSVLTAISKGCFVWFFLIIVIVFVIAFISSLIK